MPRRQAGMRAAIGDIERVSWSLRVKRLDEEMRASRLEYAQSVEDAQSVSNISLSNPEHRESETCSDATPAACDAGMVNSPVHSPSTRSPAVVSEQPAQERSSTPDTIHTVKAADVIHGNTSHTSSNPARPLLEQQQKVKNKAHSHEPPTPPKCGSQMDTSLMRAVADLADDLSVVKEAMHAMEAKAAALEESNAELLQTVANITDELGTAQLVLRAATSNAHSVAQGHVALKNLMDAIQAEQFSLRVAEESLSAKVAALSEASSSSVLDSGAVAERLGALDGDLCAVHNAVNAMGTVVKTLDIPQLQDSIYRQRIMDGQVSKLMSTVEWMQRGVAQAISLKTIAPSHTKPHPSVQAAIQEMEGRMGALESKSTFEAAEEKEVVAQQLANYARQQDAFQDTLKELGTKIKVLEGWRVNHSRGLQTSNGATQNDDSAPDDAVMRAQPTQISPQVGSQVGPRKEKVSLWFKQLHG